MTIKLLLKHGRMVKKYLFIVAFLVPLWGHSQELPVNFYNYNTSNGLPTNACHFVYRDSYGFLWIASFDGLFRWDGYSFKKYTHNDSTPRSIDNSIVYSIFEDSRRRLWVTTLGGLNLYNRETNDFSKCEIRKGVATTPINAILEDRRHRLWLGTSTGLCRYDHDRQESAWFSGAGDVIFCMALDTADNIWVASFKQGIKKFNQSTGTFTRPGTGSDNTVSSPGSRVTCILTDRLNNAWIGTEGRGVRVLNSEGVCINRYDFPNEQNSTVHNNISCLYEDRNHTIWIGVQRSSVYYIDTARKALHPFDVRAGNNNRRLQSVNSIREDESGNTWFATQDNGLFCTNRYKNRFRNYPLGAGENFQGLPLKGINCFYEDKKGVVWIGTEGGGLLQFNPSTGRLSQPLPDGLRRDAINDIKADAAGTLWMATWEAGVKSFDPATGDLRHYLHDPANAGSLVYNDAKAILPDDSLVWIGTHGEGLAAYNRKNGRFIDYRNNKSIPFDLHAPTWINHLFKDSRKRLWISTYSGVFVFDGRRLQRFDHNADTGSISGNSVNMVTEDGSGNIWVISEQGLDRFDDSSRKFIRYTAAYHLPNGMKSIFPAKDNTLRITCNEGLLIFDPRTQVLKKFDAIDGLAENTYQKAVLIAAGGTCYTGGAGGFSVFGPAVLQPVAAPSWFYFTDLYIYNELQHPAAGNPALQKELAFTDTLTLSHTQAFFSVGFTAINLYAPSKTRYSYRLQGLQEQWIDVTGERKVSFTRLPAGHYELRIRYTDMEGKWREAPKTLHIIMLPPWWQTWWCKTAIVLLLLAGITGLFYRRLAAIRKRNTLLKAEVARQTTELQQINAFLVEQRDEIMVQKETLEQSNAEMLRQSDKIIDQQQHIVTQNQALTQTVTELEKLNHTKDHFFSLLAHDLKNPVAALTDITDYIQQNLQKINSRELERYLDSLKHSSAAVYELLVNLLNWSRTQSKQVTYTPVDISLPELVTKNLQLLGPQLSNKHIRVQSSIPAGYRVWADYNMIDTVMRNLLSNSIKFSDYNGWVTVSAAETADGIELCIQDNGMGMTPAQLENLFVIGKTMVSAGTAGEKGTGLGLVIAKEFVDINHGRVRVESTPGRGTSFYISLPPGHTDAEVNNTPAYPGPAPLDLQDAPTMDRLLKIKGKKLLIVEDNREVRDYLKLILSGTFEMFEAANGEEGLAMATVIFPAVIITDLLMPGMDGLLFCREIKTNPATSHLPVIILSSQWDHDVQASGYEAGADVYLTKPVRKELLLQVILNLLQKEERLHERILAGMQNEAPFSSTGLPIGKTDEAFLQRLVQFIEAHIADPQLDARLLAREMTISRSILYTKIKALTGQSVHEFIKSIRLQNSLKLLLEGRLSISQVAFEVGFNSHSYFDKCFVKQYKMGPREYINTRIR